MTSLLEAVADVRTMSRPASVPPRPSASESGLRLAMQLRDVPAKSGACVLLFVPAGRNGDASPAAGDAVSAFLDVQEGPLLIVDLRVESFADMLELRVGLRRLLELRARERYREGYYDVT